MICETPLSAQQLSDDLWRHTFSLPISTFSALGLSHVMCYINLCYLLTVTYLLTCLLTCSRGAGNCSLPVHCCERRRVVDGRGRCHHRAGSEQCRRRLVERRAERSRWRISRQLRWTVAGGWSKKTLSILSCLLHSHVVVYRLCSMLKVISVFITQSKPWHTHTHVGLTAFLYVANVCSTGFCWLCQFDESDNP